MFYAVIIVVSVCIHRSQKQQKQWYITTCLDVNVNCVFLSNDKKCIEWYSFIFAILFLICGQRDMYMIIGMLTIWAYFCNKCVSKSHDVNFCNLNMFQVDKVAINWNVIYDRL